MNIDEIRIDKDTDLLVVTVGLHRAFIAKGRLGLEAEQLYMHLQFTARLQETNQVKAKDVYLRRGLKLGIAKVKSLKSILKKMGLIDYVQARDELGRLGEQYILVKLMSRESAAAEMSYGWDEKHTAGTEIRSTGSSQQMLKERKRKERAASKKNNPLALYEKTMQEMQSAYKERYGVNLVIPNKTKAAELFAEVGSDDILICAFRIYLDERSEWLLQNKHPWPTFLSQLTQWCAKARDNHKPKEISQLKKCPQCGWVVEGSVVSCTTCGVDMASVKPNEPAHTFSSN